ncbi:molybdopterin-dependent oxidoreductase [Lignipirellula cremea]|uniref:Serine/threonine-protein kinase B n=1 Tax=Lignipirellula cremea TaxID=2528010 RepID=A0A518E1V8_9BACT|nr:molybdopterin-dependent oxidoreductase [Lignipirellula cremea]QDU98061.1 Serine/threonine-protein kinase B [Lignipirellula cremea]
MPAPLPPRQQLAAPHKWPVVDHDAPLPTVGPWTLEIHWPDRLLARLTLDELQQLPQGEHTIDVHCVTRWSKPGMRFRGVLLATLLDHVLPQETLGQDVRFLSFVAHSQDPKCSDPHSTSLPLPVARELGVLLAWEAAGEPLPVEHGGPLRVITPGRYFYKSLKWLARIDLLAADRLGHWEAKSGYHNTADPWKEQRYAAAGFSRQQMADLLQQRDVSGQNLVSLDLSQHGLSGFQAQGALLRDANFSGADLTDADFTGANLSNARLIGANLQRADFQNADLEGADFTGADLRGANLCGALLTAVTFGDGATGTIARFDAGTRVEATALEALTPDQEALLRAAVACEDGPVLE